MPNLTITVNRDQDNKIKDVVVRRSDWWFAWLRSGVCFTVEIGTNFQTPALFCDQKGQRRLGIKDQRELRQALQAADPSFFMLMPVVFEAPKAA